MFSATVAFATPIGYQTHMMVYGPGGYRFSDFVRVGVPLDILLPDASTRVPLLQRNLHSSEVVSASILI